MLDREALKAKMQAAGHIDGLAETARWSKFAPDWNDKHANDIGEDGFDTFTTYFEDSDGQYYRVRFTAGVNEDMDTAYSIGQMDKRNHPSSAGSSSAPFGRGAQNTRMVSEDSVAPDNTNVNTFGTKFKGLALQREYRQSVENGNMTRAREILAEKAARNGRVLYDITKIKRDSRLSGKYATPLAQSTSTFENLYNGSVAPDNTNVNTSGTKFKGLSADISVCA